MPITPIAATHRLQINIAVPGLPDHKMRIFLNAAPSADPDGYDFLGFSGNTGMSVAVPQLLNALKFLWDNTVGLGGAVLEKYVSGAYVVIAADSTGITGSGAGFHNICQQTVLEFTDFNGKVVKQLLPETVDLYVGHFVSVVSTPAPLNVYIPEVINTGAGHIGNWIVGRSSGRVVGFKSATLGDNEKYRRARGLA